MAGALVAGLGVHVREAALQGETARRKSSLRKPPEVPTDSGARTVTPLSERPATENVAFAYEATHASTY